MKYSAPVKFLTCILLLPSVFLTFRLAVCELLGDRAQKKLAYFNFGFNQINIYQQASSCSMKSTSTLTLIICDGGILVLIKN